MHGGCIGSMRIAVVWLVIDCLYVQGDVNAMILRDLNYLIKKKLVVDTARKYGVMEVHGRC